MGASVVGISCISLLVLLFLKVPVFVSLLGACMTYFSMSSATLAKIFAQRLLSGVEKQVKAGDVIIMQAGMKHTIIADTELKVIEVQMGKDISVHDKQKFEYNG